MENEGKIEQKIEGLLNELTLEEKVSLCHANSNFTTAGIERLGIDELTMMDGPHGVRSELERHSWNSLNRQEDRCTYLPTEGALAATWNPKLARRFGETLGSEARYRGKDIILGPGVNIIRTPLCGRNFEYLSEDPCLTGKLGAEIVKGIESQDTAACVKHYALNNQELDRFFVNVSVSKRALFEIYLKGFYSAIIEGGASSVMGAYNQYEGQHCCHHQYLVNEILKDKWGFSGVYLTDWGGCHDTEEAIFNGLDLEMGSGADYDAYYLADRFLEKARESEEVRQLLDDKVRRILRLMLRIHKLSPDRKKGAFNTKEHQQTTYDIASEAIVLLKNEEHVLPMDIKKTKKILVMGPNADKQHAEGGSSSGVRAVYEVTPLAGIKNRLSDCVEIEYERGSLGNTYHDIPVQSMEIIEKKAGVRAFQVVSNGKMKKTEYRNTANIKDESAESFDMECNVCIPETGTYGFRINSCVGYTFCINDRKCLSQDYMQVLVDFQCQKSSEYSADFVKGEIVNLKIHLDSRNGNTLFDFGWMTPSECGSDMEQVWKKVSEADYVVYCGGLDHNFDTEGMDKKTMQLPLEQNTVIERLVELNANTIVVLTAGTPVEMPWVEKVKALIWMGYAGMEGGNALCDILTGHICPSGKMSFTLPYRYEDTPVARYGEYEATNCTYYDDIFVGYRGYDKDDIYPMFAFGHGLSYTQFEYSDLHITVEEEQVCVCFKVKNVGKVTAKETTQVYVGDPVCSVVRPPKELRAFQKVELKPGETKDIKLDISERDLAFYDEVTEDWKVEPGEFMVYVGSSSRDIRLKESFVYTNKDERSM